MNKFATPALSSVVSRNSSRVEVLESRIAPAVDVLSIGGTTVASFTDADGDVITVRISGSAGSVDLNEIGNTNGVVDNGEAIGSVAITGASSDFVISFSVDSTGASNGVVALGEVTSDRTIFALNTVPDTSGGVPTSDFQLLSFKGPGFSSGGGLNVNSILGGSDGVGLALNSLQSGVTINARADINGTVTINGVVGGALLANTISSSTVTLGGLGSTGTLTTAIGISSDVTINGTVAGDVTIGGGATGIWSVGALPVTGSLQAGSWTNLTVNGTLAGQVAAVNGDLTNLTVAGSLGRTAQITATGATSIDITGSVPAKARIDIGGTAKVLIGKSFAGTLMSNSSIDLDVTSGVLSGHVGSEGSATIQAKSINKLSALFDSGSTFTVEGAVNNSKFYGGDSTLTLTAGGAVSNTVIALDGLEATTGSLNKVQVEGSEGDVSITVNGSVSNSSFGSGSEDVILTVSGNVTKSLFTAPESDVTLDIGGSATGLYIDAASDVTVTVGGNLANSRLFGDEGSNVVVNVGQKLINTVVSCGSEEISATIGSDVVKSKFFAPESEISLSVGGNLIASQLSGSEITATIGGSVMASRLESNDSAISLTVAGSLKKSSLESTDGVELNITGDVADVQIGAAGTSNLTLGRNFTGTFANSTGSLVFSAAGKVAAGSVISNGGDARIEVGTFDGVLSSRVLDFTTTGSVGTKARLQATSVADLNANSTGFSVGGSFSGRLAVTGNFTTGTGASAVVVEGAVQKSARIVIGGSITGGATQYLFNDDFLGLLQVNGDINQDLSFDGNVNSLFVGEQINADLRVIGKVAMIVAGNHFEETDGNDGTFRDGAGNATGTLDTDSGHGKVVTTI